MVAALCALTPASGGDLQPVARNARGRAHAFKFELLGGTMKILIVEIGNGRFRPSLRSLGQAPRLQSGP